MNQPEFKGSPNSKIYIQADDRAIGAELSPCVSPEPEEQPMKKLRIDPKHDMLNRSSIATQYAQAKKGFKSSFFPIYNGAVPNALKMGCSHMSYAYAMDSHNISPFTMASMRPEAIIMMTS